ncbi:cell division protein FtsL [Crenobacter cavernae]|uniref:Cell division protein FtsL n=1 Tax=Crenobacter cavernae TaxID=2290923 RepID=A0ABY0FDZ8_9NEIS|nr:cell division protein FtsL [Crenobacter cavernae]RXZ44452.1 cell division protein FtsL [Crenobacter cavernae]
MNRLNVLLLTLVVFSSWSVVTAQYDARKRYSELEKEQKLAQTLEVDYGRLLLEQSTWGAHARIEKAVGSRLKMHTPDQREVQIVSVKGGA